MGKDLLELKKVSKFYYQKNTVATGFSKVDLKLNLGEFVVITGESGSGKSTLLNVLSGLDSYEEGEMYINGEETSGYTETDFENYRKKYIGNVFQSFNLVNSYTVYQNIELVLLINGFKKSEIKEKIIDVIKKVDLLKYKNTKVSKLSGGQKQRVAIARALVKDTPILIADEPTGNLDSKSASDIMNLLYEVSKGKLMILVTHNYEQVEQYATRKLTMHDGKIVEDKFLNDSKPTETVSSFAVSRPMKNTSKLRLGIRNTFNILPKFLLLLFVYIVLTLAALGGYSALKKQSYEKSKNGYNYYFLETNPKRIVIKKNDKSPFSNTDYENIRKISNVDYILEDDLLADTRFIGVSNNYAIPLSLDTLDSQPDHVDIGRMPQNEHEAILTTRDNYPSIDTIQNSILEKDFDLRSSSFSSFAYLLEYKIKIVGVTFRSSNDSSTIQNAKLYLSNDILKDLRKSLNPLRSEITIHFNGHILDSNDGIYQVVPSRTVPRGTAYAFEDFNYMAKNNNCKNKNMTIKISNLYFDDELTVKITKTFNKRNIKSVTGTDNYEIFRQAFFVNWDDYYGLFDRPSYQSSVFVKNEQEVDNTINDLNNLGFKTLYVKDALLSTNGDFDVIVNAVMMIVVLIVIVALFFLSYFIIKIILKSRNVYFSTIRILGATRKNAKQLLKIELLTVLHIAFLLVIIFCACILNNIVNIDFIYNLIVFIKFYDYIILYIALIIISLLISIRYARQLFKDSAMNTYREEV